MIYTTHDRAFAYTALIQNLAPGTVPAKTPSDAYKVGLCELLTLWVNGEFWETENLLQFAGCVKQHIATVAGDAPVEFDVGSLSVAMRSASAALLVVKLAGGWPHEGLRGHVVWTNRRPGQEGAAVRVSFPEDFVRRAYAELLDDVDLLWLDEAA